MKRRIVAAMLSLTAVFLLTSPAVGQSATTASKTSSKVLPHRDKTKPYKFKTTGKVKFPKKYCAPSDNKDDCIPITCPPGAKDAKYCTKPPLAQVCTGQVKIVFKAGTTIVSSKTVSLTANCTYSSTTTITKKAKKIKVSARFLGNTILAPSSASTKSARAG